jgi:hypothetical protein
MLAKFEAENKIDKNGNPTGGTVVGVGLVISWQDGPLGRGEDRLEPNGAFVETVIAAAKQRIEFYQAASNGKFFCEENAEAISHLNAALDSLNSRTVSREARQVEGTHSA